MKTYEEFRSAYDRYLLKKIVFTVSCLGIIVVAFFIGMIVGDYTTTSTMCSRCWGGISPEMFRPMMHRTC